MANRLYDDEQLHWFYDDYISFKTWSLSNFARHRRLSYYALRNGFKKLNLEIIPQEISKRKFPINDNFFEEINTEEKAYFLGFLFADGCNTPSKNRLEVSLAKQDRTILERLSIVLHYGNINIKEYKSKKKKVQDKVALYIINKKISSDLEKWGCVSRKTFVLRFPDIPRNLHQHFIRGYFDGDGSITINYRKPSLKYRNKIMEAAFSIVSTKEMLNDIKKYITDLGINCKIGKRHKNKKNNNFTLRVFGNKQINKVCDFIYKNATVFLRRKFDNYLKLARRKEKVAA